MPEIVSDLRPTRLEHARLADRLANGLLTRGEAKALAVLDDEIVRFHALCMGVKPFRLYADGILPGDELRHPGSSVTVRASIGSKVVMDGETITLMEATRRIAASGARGPAVGDWEAHGKRIGDSFKDRPGSTPIEDASEDGPPNPVMPVVGTGEMPPAPTTTAPVNFELPF